MGTSKKLTLADFLIMVPEEYRDFVTKTGDAMIKGGSHKQKIEKKTSGLVASYRHPENNRVHLQFNFNNDRLSMNLHPIFFAEHDGYLDGLPSCIASQIGAFGNCRECRTDCYQCKFSINGIKFHKCKYGYIGVEVNEESMGLLSVFR